MRHRFTSPSYTREQMVELYGELQIRNLENCPFEETNRVMHNETEFVSYNLAKDNDGYVRRISAYCYIDNDDLKIVDDIDNLDWEIDDYGID